MLPEFLELRICHVLRRFENFAPTGGPGILSAPTITAYGPASLHQFPGGGGWSLLSRSASVMNASFPTFSSMSPAMLPSPWPLLVSPTSTSQKFSHTSAWNPAPSASWGFELKEDILRRRHERLGDARREGVKNEHELFAVPDPERRGRATS